MSATPKDGIPRRAVVRVPVIAVSAKTLGAMVELSGGSALAALTKQPGFPAARYPTGSSTPRWLVSEVRAWLAKGASTVSAGRKKYRPRKSLVAAEQTNQNPVEVIQ